MTIHLVDIDHVGIAVDDLEGSVERYRAMLGVEPVLRERVEDQGVDEVLFAVGSSFIQLLGAVGPDSPVGRSLATRGPGLHHVAYRVRDLAAALEDLSAEGARLALTEIDAMAGEGLLRTADLPELLNRLARRTTVNVHYVTGYWLDVDTLRDLDDAHHFP